MDDALVPYKKDDTNVIFVSVLILVVMDDALVHDEDTQFLSMLAES